MGHDLGSTLFSGKNHLEYDSWGGGHILRYLSGGDQR